MKKYYVFIAFLMLFALAAVGVQTAASQKPLADKKRVEDLRELSRAVETYARGTQRLPRTLAAAVSLRGGVEMRVGSEPELDLNYPLSSYEYRTLDRDTYELCAAFETERKNPHATRYDPEPGYFNPEFHGRGRQCFSGDVPLPDDSFQSGAGRYRTGTPSVID